MNGLDFQYRLGKMDHILIQDSDFGFSLNDNRAGVYTGTRTH